VRMNASAVILLTICPLLSAQQPQPIPGSPVASQDAQAPPTSSAHAKPNTLLDGTPIKLRIGRNVSSADAKVGEHVDFEVLEDVEVMGLVVIAKGATASATVTEAQPKRRMGREGKLEITLDSVRLVDNEKAALTASAGGKGGSHTGAMVGAMAATAIFTLGGSALFLLMHGKDITIPKGAETTAYVNGDMQLDLTRFGASGPTNQPLSAPGGMIGNAQASLSIESTPPGADVEIDGTFVGDTPSTISIPPGSHQVSVKKKGFASWAKTLNVTGGMVHLNAELDQEPAKK